jgi:hypothetical protein
MRLQHVSALAARQIPREVFAMFRAQRLREAIPVRSLAWVGLALGLSLALFLMVVLPFWWNVGASIVVFGVTYVAAANIANWLGDALGYRWASVSWRSAGKLRAGAG